MTPLGKCLTLRHGPEFGSPELTWWRVTLVVSVLQNQRQEDLWDSLPTTLAELLRAPGLVGNPASKVRGKRNQNPTSVKAP